MMLPEHVRAIQQHHKEFQKQEKPILDEQEIERFSGILSDAIKHKKIVKIKLFDSYHDRVTGKIQKVDTERRQIKIRNQEEILWIQFNEIIDIDEDQE